MKDKFTIIYAFEIVAGKETDFINCWTALTQLIYEFEGSYGSRLHKANDQLFIGYAQWPDRATFDQSGNKMPATADELRLQMRTCCSAIKSLYELDSVVSDLLKDEQRILPQALM